MKRLVQEVQEVFFKEGKEEAKIKLSSFSKELACLEGPQWIALKAEIAKFMKVSESDYKELRKSDVMSLKVDDWSLILSREKNGDIKTGLKNCSLTLAEHPELKGAVGFNAFLQRTCFLKELSFMPDIKLEEGEYIELDSTKIAQLAVWLAHQVIEFSESSIIKSLTELSMRNVFNPLATKLIQMNVGWDRKPRLDNWLFTYLNAHTHGTIDEQEERSYISRVGTMWMLGAVARAFEPGCKVDTMLILEGKQGDGKSSLLKDLSLGYFLELTTSLVRSKDVVDSMLGKWIVELPELKALSGDSDANKAFLTKQTDKERLSYERYGKDYPRRCVFIGTTNEERYLIDLTGNRRFWPVCVGKAEREKLLEDLPHLWGEAVQRYSEKERWWFDRTEDKALIKTAESMQSMKQDYDEAQDDVSHWLEGREKVRSSQVWSGFFKGTQERFGKTEQMRVAKVLRACGWERTKIDGERVWTGPS